MTLLRAAVVIAAKDLRQRVRDRSAIVLSVAAPLALAALFSVIIPSGTFHTTYGVVDLDRGALSRALQDGPLAALGSAGVADIKTVETESAATLLVRDGDLGAAIVVPAGFSEAIQAARPTELRVVGGASVLSSEVARSVLTAFGRSVQAVQLSVATVLAASGGPADPATTGALSTAALALADPVRLDEDRTRDRTIADKTYYAASMAVMFVFFAAQFGVTGLLGERRNGTLARMLSTPVTPAAILGGKVLVSLVLGVVSMAIVATCTSVLLGSRWGDPVGVAALLVAATVAASGITLLAVSFAKSEDQAGSVTAMVTMTLAILGGSFVPMSQAPEVMAAFSRLTPHSWFLRGIGDLGAGGGVDTVAGPIAILLAMGVLAGAAGLARARSMVRAR